KQRKSDDIELAMGVGRQYEDWNKDFGGLSSNGRELLGKGFSLYCFAKQLHILFINREGFSRVSIRPESITFYFRDRTESFYFNKVGGFSWPGLTRDLAQEEADYQRQAEAITSSPIEDNDSLRSFKRNKWYAINFNASERMVIDRARDEVHNLLRPYINPDAELRARLLSHKYGSSIFIKPITIWFSPLKYLTLSGYFRNGFVGRNHRISIKIGMPSQNIFRAAAHEEVHSLMAASILKIKKQVNEYHEEDIVEAIALIALFREYKITIPDYQNLAGINHSMVMAIEESRILFGSRKLDINMIQAWAAQRERFYYQKIYKPVSRFLIKLMFNLFMPGSFRDQLYAWMLVGAVLESARTKYADGLIYQKVMDLLMHSFNNQHSFAKISGSADHFSVSSPLRKLLMPYKRLLTEYSLDPYHNAVLDEFVRSEKYEDSIAYTAADNYLLKYRYLLEQIYSRVVDLQSKKLIELGCGPAVVVETLRRLGGLNVIGLEADPRFVSFARKHGIPAFQGTLMPIPEELAGRTFNLTFSNFFLDALATVEITSGNSIKYRRLEPDERLTVLSAIASLTSPGSFSIHVTCYSMPFTKTEFRAAGFRVIKYSDNQTLAILRKESASSPAVNLFGASVTTRGKVTSEKQAQQANIDTRRPNIEKGMALISSPVKPTFPIESKTVSRLAGKLLQGFFEMKARAPPKLFLRFIFAFGVFLILSGCAHQQQGRGYSLEDSARDIRAAKCYEMVADYTKLIKSDPESAELHYQRGIMYNAAGNYEEAKEDFSKVIKFDPNFIPRLTEHLKSDDIGLRYVSLWSLAETRKNELINPIINVYHTDEDMHMKRYSVVALANFDGPLVNDFFHKAVTDKDDFIQRIATLESIKRGLDSRVLVDSMIKISQSKVNKDNLAIKQVVTFTLATKTNSYPEAVQPIKNALIDRDPLIIKAAALGVSVSNDKRFVDPMIPMLKFKDEQVRENTAIFLGQFNESKTVKSLIPLLKDDNVLVRRSTVLSLGDKIKLYPQLPGEFVNVLKTDDDPWVKYVAAFSLQSVKTMDVKTIMPLIRQVIPEIKVVVISPGVDDFDLRTPGRELTQDITKDWQLRKILELGGVKVIEHRWPGRMWEMPQVQRDFDTTELKALDLAGKNGIILNIGYSAGNIVHERLFTHIKPGQNTLIAAAIKEGRIKVVSLNSPSVYNFSKIDSGWKNFWASNDPVSLISESFSPNKHDIKYNYTPDITKDSREFHSGFKDPRVISNITRQAFPNLSMLHLDKMLRQQDVSSWKYFPTHGSWPGKYDFKSIAPPDYWKQQSVQQFKIEQSRYKPYNSPTGKMPNSQALPRPNELFKIKPPVEHYQAPAYRPV
ncbi:MAG: HEAT repeat domain-containing protein, partial [Candidatus Omnitrophica bacterium]|nr:HEAT repeat domain-containing protein [Candidatus Omnitrophota bacterium]